MLVFSTSLILLYLISLLEQVVQMRACSGLAAPRLNTTTPLYLQLHQQKLSKGRKEREDPALSRGGRKGLSLLQETDEAPLKSSSSTALSSTATESGAVVPRPRISQLPSAAIAKVNRNQLLTGYMYIVPNTTIVFSIM